MQVYVIIEACTELKSTKVLENVANLILKEARVASLRTITAYPL